MDSPLPTGVRFAKSWTCKVGTFRALFWAAQQHLRTVVTDVHGTCHITSDVTVEKWHKGKQEWREVSYNERPSTTKGGRVYRVDLALRAGLAEERVYLHRLVFFIASALWPLTPQGWGMFAAEYPEKEIDHGRTWTVIDSGKLVSAPWLQNRLQPTSPGSAAKVKTTKQPPRERNAKKRAAPVDAVAAPASRKSRRTGSGGGAVPRGPRLTISVNPDHPELDYGAPLLDAEERDYGPPTLAVVDDRHLAEEEAESKGAPRFPWPHWPKRAAVKMREALDRLIDLLS